jgi:hypothetical protein
MLGGGCTLAPLTILSPLELELWATLWCDLEMSQDAERFELIDNLVRCRDLLGMLRDPSARKTIEDLIVYLEDKLRAMDTRVTDRI